MNAIRCLFRAMPLLFAGLVLWADGGNFPIRSCEVFRIEGEHSARIVLRGSSNVQNWSASTNLLHIEGEEEIDLKTLAAIATPAETSKSKLNPADDGGIVFSLPVDSLDASNARMLRDLKAAVGHPDHSRIVYRLLNATPDAEAENTWDVTGRLRVAGEDREVSHRIEVHPAKGNGWTVSGSMDLKMTWFGITPPRALLGMVRAHDGFTVDFNIHVDAVCTLMADHSNVSRATGN